MPGQLSGTPLPRPPAGRDLVLEINLDGARQVRDVRPDAIVILIVAPSIDAQVERMRRRGDTAEQIARRVELGRREEQLGRELAHHVVVNDDLERAVAEVAGIVVGHRTRPLEGS